MQSQTRDEMSTTINEYRILLRKAGLQAALDKTIFFLEKVKFLGQVVSPDGIQPTAKRVDALRNINSPQSQRDVMKAMGCVHFYSFFVKKIHVDSQLFYDLINDSTPFHWTEDHEKLFNSFKKRIHKDTVLAVPCTYNPFHIHVDSSNVGTGYILMQQIPEGKGLISFNSRVFGKAEQKSPLSIENYAEAYELSRQTNNTPLYHHLPYIFTATINLLFFYGDAEDNYLIVLSNTRW